MLNRKYAPFIVMGVAFLIGMAAAIFLTISYDFNWKTALIAGVVSLVACSVLWGLMKNYREFKRLVVRGIKAGESFSAMCWVYIPGMLRSNPIPVLFTCVLTGFGYTILLFPPLFWIIQRFL